MKKISDIFQQKKRTYSFEIFPPKTEIGYGKLLKIISRLCTLKPDFISCTYGAGGGNREKTFDLIQHVQEEHQVTGLAHLTCVLNTKIDIKDILDHIKLHGINNVLALRGDPPKDNPDWQPKENNFKYCSELCSFIRKNYYDSFCIGVAGFPEGHITCPDKDLDARYLKIKIDNGGDFVITQLFFNNQDYFDYIKRLRAIGVSVRVIPGILPIIDFPGLLKFADICGATITDEIKQIFTPIQDNKQKTLKAGIKFAIKQCTELLNNGAPGIHFYCLNNYHPTDVILTEIKKQFI